MKLLCNLPLPRSSQLPRCLVPPPPRGSGRSLAASLLLALGTSALWACGSTPEVVKQPEPVKVQWSQAGGSEDTRGSGDDATPTGVEVDLDAPAKQSAKEAPKPAEAPPAPEPPEAAAEAAESAAEPQAPAPAEEAAEQEAPAEPAAAVPLGKEIRAAVRGNEPKEKPAKKRAAKPKKPAAEPEAAAPAYSGSDGCRAKSFSIPRVAEACAKNGRSGAKSVMKIAISKALAGGASLKCADCHSDLRSYGLKEDAVEELKKWLGP